MGSNKTAMTIPGGSRVINVFDGNGAPPVPNFFLFFDAVRFLEVSQESPRVDTRRGQSPTPHARALPSVHTYKQGPLRSIALNHDLPKFSIQSSLGSAKHLRMRRRRLPDHKPIPEGVRGPTCIRKK